MPTGRRKAGTARLARRAVARARRRARRLGATRQLQAMDLADHRVARDTVTEDGGDLACAQSLHPQLLQQLDALLSPTHSIVLPAAASIEQTPPPRCRNRAGS